MVLLNPESLIPETVSENQLRQFLGKRIWNSPLFQESVKGVKEDHKNDVRKVSGLPVLESHIYQSLYILHYGLSRMGVQAPVWVYTGLMNHDRLEDALAKEGGNDRERQRAADEYARRYAQIESWGEKFKTEGGHLVLPFVLTLTKPTHEIFEGNIKEQKRQRDDYYEKDQLVHGVPGMDPRTRKKIQKWWRLGKGCDSASNLRAPWLKRKGRTNLLRKGEAYGELLEEFPWFKQFHQSILEWARRQPMRMEKNLMGTRYAGHQDFRYAVSRPSGATKIVGPTSTTILFGKTEEDPRELLAENIHTYTTFVRRKVVGGFTRFRGSAYVKTRNGSRLVFKPIRGNVPLHREAALLADWQRLIKEHQIEGVAAEKPIGVAIGHGELSNRAWLIVQAAPDGSMYPKGSSRRPKRGGRQAVQTPFERVRTVMRQAGYRVAHTTFHPRYNWLVHRSAPATITDLLAVGHENPRHLEQLEERWEWLRDSKEMLEEAMSRRVQPMSSGERTAPAPVVQIRIGTRASRQIE